MDRRTFIKQLTALPVAQALTPLASLAPVAPLPVVHPDPEGSPTVFRGWHCWYIDADVNSWHCWHIEADSEGCAIAVSDGIHPDWDGSLLTREDGTHDIPDSQLKAWMHQRSKDANRSLF